MIEIKTTDNPVAAYYFNNAPVLEIARFCYENDYEVEIVSPTEFYISKESWRYIDVV